MAIFILRWEEENGTELYYVQKCLHIESDAVPSLWEFRFAKELQELFCEEYISLQTPLPFPGALAA